VVEIRRSFDALDVGSRDIDGTFAKHPNAMYARHQFRLMLDFVPIGKTILNLEQSGSIHHTATRINQQLKQPEPLSVLKNQALKMTS